MTERRRHTSRVLLGPSAAIALALALTSCAIGGPAHVSTEDATVCTPAAVGEKFLVGDIFMIPAGDAPVVESIEFAESTGVKVTEQAALTTVDTGGYYLYPLSGIEADAEAAAEWAARTELPSDGPIDTVDELDPQGNEMQRAAIVAVVERTGEAAGFLRSAQIVYRVGGVAHRAEGILKYWLIDGSCEEHDAGAASIGWRDER